MSGNRAVDVLSHLFGRMKGVGRNVKEKEMDAQPDVKSKEKEEIEGPRRNSRRSSTNLDSTRRSKSLFEGNKDNLVFVRDRKRIQTLSTAEDEGEDAAELSRWSKNRGEHAKSVFIPKSKEDDPIRSSGFGKSFNSIPIGKSGEESFWKKRSILLEDDNSQGSQIAIIPPNGFFWGISSFEPNKYPTRETDWKNSDNPDEINHKSKKILGSIRTTLHNFTLSRRQKELLVTHSKKELNAVEELISTESNFVRKLGILIEKFVRPLKANSEKYDVTHSQLTTLFSNIEIIHALHTKLLIQIQDNVDNVGEVFIKYGDFLKMYTHYLNGYEKALHMLHFLSGKANFRAFLMSRRKDPAVEGTELPGFLIIPVQRIPQYRLLLSEIRKGTSQGKLLYSSLAKLKLDEAFLKISEIADHVNETQRTFESMSKMVEIQSKIRSSNDDHGICIVRPGRLLLCERTFNEVVDRAFGPALRKRIVYIFNDCIIVVRPNFGLLSVFPINNIKLCAEDYKDMPGFVLSDMDEEQSYLLLCHTKEERDELFLVVDKIKESFSQLDASLTSQMEPSSRSTKSPSVFVSNRKHFRKSKFSKRSKSSGPKSQNAEFAISTDPL